MTEIKKEIGKEILQKPTKKLVKKYYLIYGLLIIVSILFLFAYYIYFQGASKTYTNEIPSEKLALGISVSLEENKEIEFEVNNEKHTIKVSTISDDTVEIVLQSEHLIAKLKIGEKKRFDLNGDGMYDLLIRFNGFEDGKIKLSIKEINERVGSEIIDDFSDTIEIPDKDMEGSDDVLPGDDPSKICGNNIKEPGEECDDGNKISGDGCSSLCLNEVISNDTPTTSGNGTNGNGGGEGTNQPPTIELGENIIISDSNTDGSESVTINPIVSDDGSIVSYNWRKDGVSIGSSSSLTYSFSIGVNDIRLDITDDDGATAFDNIKVIVTDPNYQPQETQINSNDFDILIHSPSSDNTYSLSTVNDPYADFIGLRFENVTKTTKFLITYKAQKSSLIKKLYGVGTVNSAYIFTLFDSDRSDFSTTGTYTVTFEPRSCYDFESQFNTPCNNALYYPIEDIFSISPIKSTSKIITII